MKNLIEINNGQFLEVKQIEDGSIAVYKRNKYGALLEMGTIIEPGDFVTMLNWYRYQKENGNESLMF